MLTTVQAIVRNGKIELLEALRIPEGAIVLVTVLPDEDQQLWLQASGTALDRVWDNSEDDIYAQLLAA